MAIALDSVSHSNIRDSGLQSWLPILVGLAVLYLPTWYGLAGTIWQTDEQGHGPIILAVAAWLFWDLRKRLLAIEPEPARFAGWCMLSLGLALYVLGRSQDIILLEVGSQILVGGASLLLMVGWSAIRLAWFPLFFLIFMIPVPAFVIDALTGPLKHQVSVVAESLLYLMGYPVARSGVVINIGQYQLLVADACSGLNSMFSLTALGALYAYLTRQGARWVSWLLIGAILPIAFAANIVRVILLVLVTYHYGDAAGQGFIHGFAGMVLFTIALMLLFMLDALLRRIARSEAREAV